MADSGPLDDRRATTHQESLGPWGEFSPAVAVAGDPHFGYGEVITSAGISVGIDLALRGRGPVPRRADRTGDGPAHAVFVPENDGRRSREGPRERRWRRRSQNPSRRSSA